MGGQLTPRPSRSRIFGPFVFDEASAELRKYGVRVRLHGQPLQILTALIRQPGQVVTRDEFQQQLWKGSTFVDFDHGLHAAMNRLRQALGDSADQPRYIETLPGRGYRFVAAVQDTDQTMAAAGHAQPERRPPSIAVLPFANMSADQENEYFSDGLAEEILNLLGRISGLKVIARTSAFAFKGKHEDIRRIAEAMDVTNILEGSVRRAGNRIRVTAQLIAAVDGSHLWSERYDRELSDVFAIQDDIAQAIATALQVKLAAKPCQYKPTLPAYEALLRGRYYRPKFTSDAHARAKECFEQAIALDPNYAAPHAELGLNYLLSPPNAVRTMIEVAPFIRAEARRALELDPSEGNSQFLLGAVAAAHDYDWKAAADHFAKAMSGISVSAEAHWAYAVYYLRALGLRQEAVEQMQRAVEQDPLNVAWRAILAHILSTTEMYDRALEELRKALELDESHWLPNFILAETYLESGKLSEAAAAAERAYRANPRHSMTWGIFAAVLARLGEKDRAAALVREGGESPNPIWGRVLYHLFCSEIDQAASWYERMIQQREPFATIFASDSVLKPLRESGHWPKLARLMNLPGLVLTAQG
jgi:TolB-like protein/Tfp pilus assembly protein PilF